MEIDVNRVDPTDVIVKTLRSDKQTDLKQKLTKVFDDVFNGDELIFLIVAITGIRKLINTVPRNTTVQGLINIWADQQLRACT